PLDRRAGGGPGPSLEDGRRRYHLDGRERQHARRARQRRHGRARPAGGGHRSRRDRLLRRWRALVAVGIEPAVYRRPRRACRTGRLRWTLPADFQAGPIQWPYPRAFSQGPVTSYGYEDEVLLPVKITPPASLAAGEVTLAARADWLECQEACIPGRAELSLVL